MTPVITAPRWPGLHVSDVIRDLENTVTKPGQRTKFEDLSPGEQKRMGNWRAVGWAWEVVIRDGLIRAGAGPAGIPEDERYVAPGEMVLDGIAGNPDWLDTVSWEVIEFKCTWRSSRRDIETDFWAWVVQIKAYCLMLRTRRARLYVFFVNGDYRDSGPQYKQYGLEFTELELRDNWDMLLNHGRLMNERATGGQNGRNKKT